MRHLRQTARARRERRWLVQREREDDGGEREEIILGLGGRDNEAPKLKPAR